MMKVVHTSGSLEEEASGPSYSVPATARATQSLGHDVHVMSIGPTGQDTDRGFTHHRFDNAFASVPVLRGLSAAPSMKRALRAQGADIIHTQGLWLMPNIYAAQIAAAQATPYVITVRGMLAPAALAFSRAKKAGFGMLYQRAALRRAALFHATSEQEYRDIRAYGLTQPILLVPNGIDLPDVAPASPTQTAAKGAKNETNKTLLFFGRLHPIKGLDNLITAWSRVQADFPDWSLSLRGTGDDEYIQSLHQQIAQSGAKRVTIGGGVFGADKTALYDSADIYILPSQSENFGITVAESLAAGTPVICTDGAPWSGLRDHDCGWWVNQSPDTLEACMRKALTVSKGELHAMGQRGRQWMEAEFSWASVAMQLENAYGWLLGQADKPSAILTD